MRRPLAALTFSAALGAATFGTRVPVTGGPIDLVLDERRGQLYLADFNTNSVQVYSIPGRRFLAPIRVGLQPVSAALSTDGQFLYVTNFQSSSLSVVDLNQNVVVRNVVLPARPEGVAVGADGRVVITTLGQGPAANPTDTLIVYDPAAREGQQLTSVLNPPVPTAPPPLQITPGRIYQNFRGRLQSTPDGQFIIGVNTPAQNDTLVFVYEVASQKVLRIRRVPGLSSVLSVSPDGQRFMAGARLFDTSTLNVLATQDAANAPFILNPAFNLAQNVGGSVFSPDGATLYSAFNVAPLVIGQNRPNATTLLVNNPRNLAIRMGIQLAESVLGKMVATSDGQTVYALSDSGLLILPVGQINSFPILQPETTVVRLAANQCDRSAATRALRINNGGRGTLRYTVQPVAANTGLVVQPEGPPVAPGNLRFTMSPNVTRRIGSTLTQVILQSDDAINIPPVVRVYQNWLNAETRTATLPVETGLNPQEGLVDLVLDGARQRVYIANSPKNQIEVFDIRRQTFLDPIEAGQFPRSMAMSSDGRTLYVANAGGEWISMIDLEQGREYDRITFPPVPFNASQAPVTPRVIAMGIYGLQIWASTANNAAGTLWSSSGRSAVLRPVANAIGTATIPAPVSMVSTPGNEYIMLLAGNNVAYLYDSLADDYVVARQVMQAPVTSYYGVVGAGPEGRYFLANRAILNSTLVPVGGFAGGTAILTPPQPAPAPGPGGTGQQPPAGGGGPGGFFGGGGGGGGAGGQAPGQIPPGQTPPGPTPPQVQLTPATLRNVSAVYAMNANAFARFSTPQQANANANPTGDPQPMVEIINVNTEQVMASAPLSEGPAMQVFGNQRANITGRLLAVDTRAQVAYALTMSGLSVAPLAPGRPADRITLNPRGVVQAASYSQDLAPSGLFSLFGTGLAETASAGSLPLPTQLGGVCVTFNETPVPLLMTSPTQINGQIPPNFRAGNYTVVVRSAERGLASNAGQARVAAAAPGVFVVGDELAALFDAENFRLVTRENPARRDRVYVLFGTGIPPGPGVNLSPGAAAPSDPLATTQRVKVFIGDPRISEAEMIVEWSGFAPGFVGLNQINIRVHGDRIRGDRLPVSIQVGNISSPLEGAVVPVTYVR